MCVPRHHIFAEYTMELVSAYTASANRHVCRVEASNRFTSTRRCRARVRAANASNFAWCMGARLHVPTADCGGCVGGVGVLRSAHTTSASIFVECVHRPAISGHGCGARHGAFFGCVRRKRKPKPVLWSGVHNCSYKNTSHRRCLHGMPTTSSRCDQTTSI